MMKRGIYLLTAIASLLFASAGGAAAQSGGAFEITQSVISTGGGELTGGAFRLEETTGQPAAGTGANNFPFSLHSGFWTPEAFAPTSAAVSISGTVMKVSRRFAQRVRVTLTEQNGARHTTMLNRFGHFGFRGIEAGQIVIIQVFAVEQQFLPLVVTVTEDMTNLVLTPHRNGQDRK